MFIISSKEIKDNLLLSSLMGKKVIAKNGEVLGRVNEVAFDLGKLLGIYYKGRGGSVLLGIETIEHLDAHAVMLLINPVAAFLGRTVYDKDGKRLGKVREVARDNSRNDLTELVIRRGLFRKDLRVSKDDIQVPGKNIILSKVFSDG